jgi:uncharacterized protein
VIDAQPNLTEQDLVAYLLRTPDFFDRHAAALAQIQLASPHGGRAISLQERQAELLRDKIRGLEGRIMDMVRHGNENVLISNKLQRWAITLMTTADVATLPTVIAQELQSQFLVPQVAIKVWGATEAYAMEPWAGGVSDDARAFASSLTAPFCGLNPGFESIGWLPDPSLATSVALLPLRAGALNSVSPAFGLLVLASPDPARFAAGMGTDFLERIAELASAALQRLR